MKYTANYNLKKPEGTDIVNIDDLNDNADILDQKLKEVENKADNAPPNSVNDAAIGSRTPDQSQAPASPGTGTLTQLISWLANRIKAITGKTNWWDAPPTTLQAAKNHIDAAAPHSGHETPSGAQAKADAAETNAKNHANSLVGTLSNLLTTAKNNVVAAINEIFGKVEDVEGDLESHKAESASHVKPARIVIGTSTSGWTEKDCDYLCDGVDDQIEINQAIQDLPSAGGEIVVLDGTYNISSAISVNKSRVCIKGSGKGTVLRRRFNYISKSGMFGVITIRDVHECTVKNLQIDGNKNEYTNVNNDGIYLNSSNNLIFDVSSINNKRYGIYIATSSSDNVVTGNICNDNDNSGIMLESTTNNSVTGNICNGNDGSGIHLASSNNNNISTNVVYREDYTTSQYSIRVRISSYNLISSNICINKAVVIESGTSNTEVNNKWE